MSDWTPDLLVVARDNYTHWWRTIISLIITSALASAEAFQETAVTSHSTSTTVLAAAVVKGVDTHNAIKLSLASSGSKPT